MQLSQGGFVPELGLGQQNISMQGKEEPVPEIAARLQHVPQTTRQTQSSSKYPERVGEQFLMCCRWAAERGTAQPAQMEIRERMDVYQECASQSPVNSDPPPVLPLLLLRAVLKSLKVSLCTV